MTQLVGKADMAPHLPALASAGLLVEAPGQRHMFPVRIQVIPQRRFLGSLVLPAVCDGDLVQHRAVAQQWVAVPAGDAFLPDPKFYAVENR